ncbi:MULTISPECIES: GlsB/YeaQ/YmgE family stress response membrane protein [Gilliamella]|jgi:Predicted membrane protein|uniref:GlsB/YeaQ/YmgE family stress response membrane protein n=1 Tax=Gilliamella apis TaxID=1970738 RepID=A0A242P5F4_9GAMM|nr:MULTISPECIES: GlsB/YeaQ/YmgE family stress response membrane protein [Gilliamella]MBI0005690.1 GlsB/YeaQ/YmgE family stress response membrane protein [Gilliamella sp. W8126]MBI0037167.1 GlsB/YeaQ/YmgE family stress response membrane protein [Gilliamella sp. B14384G10]MBI0039180.1 GlsB/YeaQ/YmgE family stress response membrane protein [Gilliamella sp. B14384G7]MBI0051161.1 GlsB/YeaQ/YmgE family stress response membrane protein [Gilliamella sp. B14384G13]MBI0053454.1 GlsB/YeaQ/YmgE family str
MGILSWIILGLIAGWIAKFFMPLGQVGVLKTILLGVAGALVGGYISTFFGWGSVTGFNFPSLFISVLGAILLIYIYRLIK